MSGVHGGPRPTSNELVRVNLESEWLTVRFTFDTAASLIYWMKQAGKVAWEAESEVGFGHIVDAMDVLMDGVTKSNRHCRALEKLGMETDYYRNPKLLRKLVGSMFDADKADKEEEDD